MTPTCDRDRSPFDLWWSALPMWIRAAVTGCGLLAFYSTLGLISRML